MLRNNIEVISDEIKADLESAEIPDWFRHTKAKNGDVSFSIIQNNKVFPGTEEPPRRTGKELIKKHKFSKTEAICVVGCGLGHTLFTLLTKCEKGVSILLIEPEVYLVKQALSNFNFAKAIEEKRLLIATTKDEVAVLISYFEMAEVIENWYFHVEPYTNHLPDVYFDILQHAGKMLNSIRCNTGTMMGAGSIIAYNDVLNLPYMIKHPGVNVLKDKYKGGSAVVVSTGPSLQRNIHLLLDKKYREKVVVICVAQAARILLAYGITPDYMCTVDYGKVNLSHFEGLENCNIPLIALNKTYAPIIANWNGPLYIATSLNQERDSITDMWLKKGHVDQGGSVSHFAFGVAILFGCNRIALIGQDLAYEGNISHHSLADSSGKLELQDNNIEWVVDDPRSPIYNQKTQMGGAVSVDGFFGGSVITNTGLASFINAFDFIARQYKGKRFYNCTEGGASIPSFRHCTLYSFLNRCKKIKPNPHNEDVDVQADIKRALQYCDADLEVLNRCIDYAKKAKDSAEGLLKYIGKSKGNKFNELLNENYRCSVEAQKNAAKNPLLEIAIYKASREIAGNDLLVSGKNLKKDDSILRTRVKRNLHIIESAIEEGEILINHYKETRENLETIQAGKELVQKQIHKSHIEDCKEYLAKGNWGLPLLEIQNDKELLNKNKSVYESLLKMRAEAIKAGKEYQQNNQKKNDKLLTIIYCHEKARENGKERKFNICLKYLLFAHKIDPDDQSTWYGLASTYMMLADFDKAKEFYEKMLDETDSNQIEYEYCLCLFNNDEIEDAFSVLYKLLERTEEYDNILFDAAKLVYALDNDREKAMEVLKLYINKHENPDAYKFAIEIASDEEKEFYVKKYKKLVGG
jgi:hypothetical protein